ncbi:MAG: urease accessory protein UreE [Gammaproteobacteria bacterium]|nr:urease accessory protein UreE [Gammaproteobacteria bacterium]
MIQITEQLSEATEAQASLTLPYELRQKSRLHTRLDNDKEVGLLLPRGTVLRQGDLLRADNGLIIEIKAANEQVSTARSNNALLLARACYHLGNRHVALQIGDTWLRYLHDHVLDDMVKNLGLELVSEQAPFEPEAGAYHGRLKLRSHSHNNSHAH